MKGKEQAPFFFFLELWDFYLFAFIPQNKNDDIWIHYAFVPFQ